MSPPPMNQQQQAQGFMRSPPSPMNSPGFQGSPQQGQQVPIAQQLSQQFAHIGHGQPGQPYQQQQQGGPPSQLQSRQPSYSAGMTGLEGQMNQMNMASGAQPGFVSSGVSWSASSL